MYDTRFAKTLTSQFTGCVSVELQSLENNVLYWLYLCKTAFFITDRSCSPEAMGIDYLYIQIIWETENRKFLV